MAGFDIDFSLLGQPNALLKYAQGRQMAREWQVQENELARQARLDARQDTTWRRQDQEWAREDEARTRKQGALSAYGRGDKAAARSTAFESGDTDLIATLNSLDENQRKIARERSEAWASMALDLQSLPYAARRAKIAERAPRLREWGVPDDQINGWDPTDQNLRESIGEALGLKERIDLIEKRSKPIELDPTKNYYVQDGELGLGAPAPSPPARTPPGVSPLSGTNYTPQDRDALARMIATEAGGEGPQGMLAAGSVALNRLRTGHGGARSLRDVIYAPNQFEGMGRAGQVSPQAYQAALTVADQLLSGQAQDPTGGAIHFLNPELQAQMGRQQPAWATGPSQRIGQHVFYGGQTPGSPLTPTPAPGVSRQNRGEGRYLPTSETDAENDLYGGANGDGLDSAPQVPGYRLIHQAQPPVPDWQSDGRGNLVNTRTGDRKRDTTMRGAAKPMTAQEKAAWGLPADGVYVMDEFGKPTAVRQPAADKPPTEGMVNNASLTYAAFGGNERLNELARRGIYKPSSPLEDLVKPGNNGLIVFVGRQEQDRQYLQAALEFLAPILRKDTGAAVTYQELVTYGQTYIPNFKDGPQTLWQKAQARDTALRRLYGSGRRAYDQEYGAPGKWQVLTDPRSKPRLGKPTGGGAAAPGKPGSQPIMTIDINGNPIR